MTYTTAKTILAYQDIKLKKWDKQKFTHNGYEYRIAYEGGFAPLLCLYRRREDKRNFQYFKCVDVSDVFSITLDEIKTRAKLI